MLREEQRDPTHGPFHRIRQRHKEVLPKELNLVRGVPHDEILNRQRVDFNLLTHRRELTIPDALQVIPNRLVLPETQTRDTAMCGGRAGERRASMRTLQRAHQVRQPRGT
eukprot:CAMPEP_0201498040 /NCGR_PEP_ID=MMETSP0151_2-20130828/69043_1 /ASSEMBLY_ACC=CAM_ASM_000257 /TAXON_ID=200890 /ORGANISM="Paramoeba atlantica, Strain 621/1 / CCAP 1560/9" /LENGTH=109 /DNA_ID=CAMNT_0047889293 /DNA_START=108 /DNA_END=437 /DNA_ORIENTATION=+